MMERIRWLWNRFVHRELGAAATEYMFLLMIAVGAGIIIAASIGGGVENRLNSIAEAINGKAN